MRYLIGLGLIVVGAPLVGIIGRVLEGAGRKRLGRVVGIGVYLVVLAVAGWLVVSDL
ncbi:hypothetical protein ABZ915_32030 [Streptomyces sp. NPDC046915]|uniref:hypothetical protein n=1 Tax=Streptomyces sp. NPDC046915 TaxID=3155257 RepID=UPI0033C7449D